VARSSKKTIAIVGARSFLGRRALARCLEAETVGSIILIDQRRPNVVASGTKFYKVDLTTPTADAILLDIFQAEKVDQVLHLGQLQRPSRDETSAHEYSVIGTFHLLNAVAAAGVKHTIVASSTLVYGAGPLNPNYLSEASPLRPDKRYRYVTDMVEVEELCKRFRDRNSDKVLTTLRFAPILGPTVHNYVTDYLEFPVSLSLLGFDPLMQVLHENDAIEAILMAMKSTYSGSANIVPSDVLPLSTMLYRLGKVNVPMPHPLAYPTVGAAWAAGIAPLPQYHLDYIRYLCCGEGAVAERELDFVAEYDCAQTIDAFSSVLRLRSARFASSNPQGAEA
jgi:UDP-glucose 4-epimerase